MPPPLLEVTPLTRSRDTVDCGCSVPQAVSARARADPIRAARIVTVELDFIARLLTRSPAGTCIPPAGHRAKPVWSDQAVGDGDIAADRLRLRTDRLCCLDQPLRDRSVAQGIEMSRRALRKYSPSFRCRSTSASMA